MFRQQQHLYRSAHYLAKSKTPTLYTPPSNDGSTKGKKRKNKNKRKEGLRIYNRKKKGRKRRASYEDEEMTSSETIDYKPAVQQPQPQYREDSISHTTKRNRMSLKKEFPISKLLGIYIKIVLFFFFHAVDVSYHIKQLHWIRIN